MFTKIKVLSARRARPGQILRLLLLGMTVGLTAPTAAAQCEMSQASGATYTDMWMVGVNQPTRTTDPNGQTEITLNGTPSAYLQGYGSYEEPYNTCGHESQVDAILSSPTRSTWSAATGYPNAQADVTLPFFENDLGDYDLSQTSTYYCPFLSQYQYGGGGISSKRLGVSYTVYQKVVDLGPGRAIYQQISPCNATCGIGGASGNFVFVSSSLPPFFVVGVPFFRLFGYLACENIISSYRSSATRVECGDIGIF